jgi:hypothetical protein
MGWDAILGLDRMPNPPGVRGGGPPARMRGTSRDFGGRERRRSARSTRPPLAAGGSSAGAVPLTTGVSEERHSQGDDCPGGERSEARVRAGTRLYATSIAIGIAAGVVACAERNATNADRILTVPLAATSVNAGEIGRGFVIARGEETAVVVEVSGVPPMLASRPVHLYTFIYSGRCGSLVEPPAYALTARVLADSPRGGGVLPMTGPFRVSNVAPVPLEALRGGGHAILVRTSPADGGREIFCGNVD